MPKITEYPRAETFNDNDVLLKDGIDGTKIIPVNKVKEYMADGLATDEEVAELKTQIDTLIPIDLAGGVTTVPSTYIDYRTGEEVSSNSAFCTVLIDITGITTILYSRYYTTSTTNKWGTAFYDANGEFIPDSGIRSSLGNETAYYELESADVPSGAKYVRISGANALGPVSLYNKDDYDSKVYPRLDELTGAVSNLPNGLLPYLEFTKGTISTSGNPQASTTVIRTTTAIKYDVDTFIRCIDPEFRFAIRIYSAPEINSANYSSYSGIKNGVYKLNANTYYVITLDKSDGSTVTDVNAWSKLLEVWSPFYLETMRQYEMKNKPAFGNAKRKIIAHRGTHGGQVPGNTIPAYEAAGSGGAWGIETDIQTTSDGYLVCIHDNDLSKTTNGTGNVSDTTFADLQELHIKDHDDLKVPTLEEFLGICKIYDCVPFLDFKNPMTEDPDLVEKAIDTVVEYGLDSKAVIITSTYFAGLIRSFTAKIPCTFLINPTNLESEIRSISKFFNVGVSWNSSDYTTTHEIISQLHNAGIYVGVGSVSTVDDSKAISPYRFC